MKFANPLWLIVGLIACAALVWLFRRFDKWQRAALKNFAAGHLLQQLTVSFSRPRQNLKRILFVIGVGCLFVALARPQWGFRWEETKRRGIDILFAVDTSKSMLAQDVKPDRLTRAKLTVTDLVNKLDGDRVGLIAFAGSAFLQSPLTLDYDAFRQSLDALDTGVIPRGGTDVASAIREAQRTFGAESRNQKILVLITDGEDLEAEGVEAARAAAKDGLRIFAVGVGGTNGELIPVPSATGGTEFLKDENGQLVKSHLDDKTLKEIAQATGGLYEALGQRGEGLEHIYQQALAPLPKQELMSRRQKIYIERFQWPLLAGLVGLLLELLIGTRKRMGAAARRFVPVPVRARMRKLRPAVAVSLGLFALPVGLRASPQSAEKAYEKGNFAASQEQYAQAVEKNPAAPVLQFNLGAAAYKAGEFEKAAAAFQKTLPSDKLEVQQLAYYNLGNTQFRVGQQSESAKPEETIKTWQEALQSYEAALKLQPDDADAKFNRDLVKKKLEKLKQQQKQDQQKKDQKDQKDQSQKNNQQQGQENKEQKDQAKAGEQNSKEQKPGSPEKNKQDSGKPDQPQSPENKDQKGDKPDQQKEAGKPDDKKDEKKPGDQQPQLAKNEAKQPNDKKEPEEPAQTDERSAPGEMSKQEAKALLDSLQKGDRKLPMSPGEAGSTASQPEPPKKDW